MLRRGLRKVFSKTIYYRNSKLTRPEFAVIREWNKINTLCLMEHKLQNCIKSIKMTFKWGQNKYMYDYHTETHESRPVRIDPKIKKIEEVPCFDEHALKVYRFFFRKYVLIKSITHFTFSQQTKSK